ncbi:MAG: YeeE/YedE thiosulfate transporter family protein [Thermodesulfovibrionales bacterium]
MTEASQKYWSPYLVGVLLGLLLLSVYYIMGWGLGASRACIRITAYTLHVVNPTKVESSEYLKSYFALEDPMWKDWTFIEVFGVLLGGIIGAITSGRFKVQTERGEHINSWHRLIYAFIGGFLASLGTRFSRGCTSGLALSGGATFVTGAWLFIVATFATGLVAAPLVRRLWR